MANPDDANKSTVIITKKDGSKVKQTTIKSRSGTRIYNNGKLVFKRSRRSRKGSRSSRPDKVALARPQKEIVAEEAAMLEADVKKRASEILAVSPGGDPRELLRRNRAKITREGIRFTPKQPSPEQKVVNIPQREGIERSIKKEKGFFGKLLESPEAAIGEPISAAAFKFSGGTIGSNIGFDKAKEPPAIVRGVTGAGVALKEFGGGLKANEKAFTPIRPSGILIAGGAIIEDFGKRPALNVAFLGSGFLVGKSLGFGRGLLAAKTFSKPVTLAAKGAVVGVTATAVGLGALDIVTSEKPQERAAIVIKDFALIGAGARQGFKSGVQSSVKFREAQALKAQKAGLLTTKNPLSKDIKILAEVRKVKGITLREEAGFGVRTQRAFLDAGRSKLVDVRSIPKADFIKVTATGTRTIKSLVPPDSISRGVIKSDFQFTKNTKVALLDKKAFATVVNQAKLGFGRVSKIDFSGITSRSVVKMRFEGMKFSGERAVFNPNAPTKPGRVPLRRWLARSKPLTPAQSGQIIEFDVAAKKPGSLSDFLSVRGQAALTRDLKNTILLMRPAKTVKVFKIDALKAQPTNKFAKEISIIHGEGTSAATVQILKSETVKVKEPELQTKTVSKSKQVTKSVFEANQEFDLTKQNYVFVKSGTGFQTSSRAITGQRFGNLAGFFSRSKSDIALSSAIQASQREVLSEQVLSMAQVQLPAQRIGQVVYSRTASDTLSRQSFKLSQIRDFMSSTKNLFPPGKTLKPISLALNFPRFGAVGVFAFEVGKSGNKIRRFIRGTGFADTVLRTKRFVESGAAASFKSVSRLTSVQESRIVSLLGSDFRRAKRDSSRFVQRRSKRISSFGEKKEITFEGLKALRFQRLKGGLRL